ncbi:hypothetical protein Hanom_Chr10g00945071 [Helianthus anomalus]
MKTNMGISQEGLHHGALFLDLCHLILPCWRKNLNSNVMNSAGFWMKIGG